MRVVGHEMRDLPRDPEVLRALLWQAVQESDRLAREHAAIVAVDWPPIRPDRRPSPDGLGIRPCRSPSNASKSSPAASAAGAILPRNKVRLVEQTMQPGMTVSAVARLHGVSPSLLFQWRRRMTEGGREAVRADEEVVPVSRVRELEAKVRELERLLGRKAMETEILREALEQARPKTRLALALAATGRFPVKTVADTLGVARSNLVEQLASRRASPTISQPNQPRRGPCHRAEDETILAEIRTVTDTRPTYGYRRVNPSPEAISVLQRLPEWFKDHNTTHPHSGLQMRLPREFIKAQVEKHAGGPV
jgi:transposase